MVALSSLWSAMVNWVLETAWLRVTIQPAVLAVMMLDMMAGVVDQGFLKSHFRPVHAQFRRPELEGHGDFAEHAPQQ